MTVKTFDARDAARLTKTYAAPEIVEQRAKTRAARRGERGLEIGCGPGFLACELARDVGPTGRIVTIDASADMLAAARERAERERLDDRIELALGNAVKLEFPSESFDFVVGVQVYLYVREIDQALAEAARVLRPGGRCVIVDTDWDSCVWLTGDRERHRRIMEARMAHFAHPHLPPRLPGLLKRAGLTLDHASVIPILNLRYDPDSFSGGIIGMSGNLAMREGIPPAEVEGWARDLRSRTEDGDYFFCVNRFLFVATKPSASHPRSAGGIRP